MFLLVWMCLSRNHGKANWQKLPFRCLEPEGILEIMGALTREHPDMCQTYFFSPLPSQMDACFSYFLSFALP